MPIVRIELFAGRSDELKQEIAEEVTRLLEEKIGAEPAATTVIFTDLSRGDFFIAGKTYSHPTPTKLD